MSSTENITVFLTRRNADTTEGRGPMVNDKAFLKLKDAEDYIDRQPGIMGRRFKWSQEKYSDWEIAEIVVLAGPYSEEQELNERRKQALEKAKRNLSVQECRLLGLI